MKKLLKKTTQLWKNILEGKEPTVEELKKCIRKGTIKGSFVPVLTGSAFKNKGVQPLLDAVIDYMPSPKMLKVLKVQMLMMIKRVN